ncbi:MAG: Ig-like domain-containing protein, partial [Isosphaeraceae bacterium]
DSAQIGHVLIKGSHVYKQQGTYDITVYVTGPDGQTVSDAMATATAVPMPDPSSQPITVPTSYTGSQPLGDETLAFVADYSVSSYVAVGFSLNPIAKFQGMYNGQPDNAVSDYHAQINWGDSGSWDTSASLVSLGGGDFLVKGSHTYRDQGIYDVVVYATGPDGQTASAMTATVDVSPNPVSVTLNAPDVTDSNAASEVPYSFSLVFQNSSGLISGSSVSGATVQVVPPDNEAIPATLLSTQPSGNTDGNGDASTITANYQITPSNGDWNQAPMGTYTVNLVGSPVTGTSGGQAPQGSVGTFQVNVAVKLVLEVAQYDTTFPEGGTIPIEVQALGASGSPDPGVNGPGTIQLSGKDVATVNLQNGTGTTTITAPNQSGQYQLQGYVSNLDSGSTGINVEPDEPSPGKLLSEAAEGAAGLAELLKGLLEEDLNVPNQVAQAALKQLQGLKNVLGNVIPFLNRVPLALDLHSLWKDATQPASPANQAQFQKDFSKALKDGIELDVAWGTAVGLELNPIGAIGGFLLGSAIQEGVGAIYDTYLNAGAMTTAGQLYQALKGSGNTVLLKGGVQYFAGNGDPPPSIVLVNPPNASSGAENLSIAGQSAYAQAGAAFDGVVATFFDASGNTLVSAYNAYIAWGDGNFTQGTVSPLPGGGFEVTGSDTYTTSGIYSVGVVVTSTDGSSAVAYNAATVYPASPTGTTSAPVVSVLAPELSAENADWQTPYTFSVVYQDPGMVSIASLAGSSVQVKPPNGPAVTAQETGTQLLGNTDALGDATTIIATYQITPPGGNWYAAAPGDYTVTVGGLPVTDLSGSPAPQGGVGTFRVSVPPTVQVSPDISQLMGTTISNSTTLTLSGYAEARSTVEIYNGASPVGNVAAGADGAWGLSYETPQDGTYDFTAIATDGAGNTSAPSDDAPVEVDTLPPMSTVAALPATSQATFNVSWSGTDDPGGSGIAFYDVYVSNDGGPFTLWQSDTVSTSASYAASADHTYGFYSVATDYAGNVQATPAAAQATTEVQTTTAPSQPPPPALLPADDSGTKGDGITDDASPSLIGTTQVNATVQLQSGANEVVATTTADDNGNYTFAVPGAPLSPGAYTFRVVASNASGSSPASNPFTLTIVAPPPTPSAPTLSPSDSNGSPGGETTYSTSPHLVGTTVAGATVQLLNPGGAVVATTRANSAGAYTVQVPGPLSTGAHTYRVQIVDQYGDISDPSPARTITVVSRPAPPVTVTYAQETLNKKHQVTEVVVIFNGAVNATEADRTSTYHLATPGKGGSYTAKNAGVIKLNSASYNPASDTVILTPAKPFASTEPVQLVVYASGPNGLQDTHGRYINGGKRLVVFPTPGRVIDLAPRSGESLSRNSFRVVRCFPWLRVFMRGPAARIPIHGSAHRCSRSPAQAHWIRHQTQIPYHLHIVPLLRRVQPL